MKNTLIKTAIFSLLGVCMCLGFCFTKPDTAYAAEVASASTESKDSDTSTVESNGLGGIDVKIDGSGNVVVDGLDEEKGSAAAWNTIFIKYKGVISGVAGVITLTLIVFFLINLAKVAGSSDNPTARAAALKGLLWTGIATAGVGAVDIFLAIFYNALK